MGLWMPKIRMDSGIKIMKKLTNNEFIAKARLIHSDRYDYSLVDYNNIKNKIIIICKIHGPFEQSAEKHLYGRGCKLCGIISQKKTCLEKYGVENPFQSEIFKYKIKKTLLDKYGVTSPIQNVDIKNKIEQTCLKKYGTKNPFQNKNIIEKIQQKLDRTKINSKILKTVKEKYNVKSTLCLPLARKNMLFQRRNAIINNIFHGIRLQNKVTPQFEKEEYIDVVSKYKWKCNICGNIFEDHLNEGHIPRCQVCYPYIIDSKYEYEIIDFIKTFYKMSIIHGDRLLLQGKELDIYIPDKKIAIEFNGLYYHSELEGNKDRKYHLNKTNMCNDIGIRLIHIFEDEWRSKKEIVKNRIKNILGEINNKIFARKCIIKEIGSDECKVFLEQNHLQGTDTSKIKIGLYYNNELVSVMTFGNFRIALGLKKSDNQYEMYRFCSKLNTVIIGGSSKLLSYFVKKYKPFKIVSYADKRWSNGDLYNKLEFIKISESTPNYFYTKDHYKKYHRFGFRKSELYKKLILFDPTLSEWENMKNNGWDRIWDCGCIKYEWKSN